VKTLKTIPQGLKPNIDSMSLIGPAKAVPLLQNMPPWSFSAASKVVPLLQNPRN
jgi:hypothetical protein